ncbi:hypothetical protein MCAP1_003046 [Malassezia caprae]|uniref:Uncharacterized protein n=1 Tax=Malassezia caprae TaxID=1381934 RepID=A0AAF0EDX0_9BASI|nr:hypothetical protein MCAP1_003046 [Malassezia caprae]
MTILIAIHTLETLGIAVGVFCLIVIFVIGMLVTKRRRLFTPHIRPGFNTGYYSQQPMGPSQPYVPNQPYAPPPTYPPPATDASVAPGAPYVPPSEPYAPPPGPPPSDDVYKPPVDPPPATYPPPPGPPPSKDSS